MSVLRRRYLDLLDKRFVAALTDAEATELRRIEAAYDAKRSKRGLKHR